MDASMKQRLVGAVVLVALGVIFLPMLVKGPAPDSGVSDVSLDVPAEPKPAADTQTIELPLETPAGAGAAGATGMPSPATPQAAAAATAAPVATGPAAAAGDYAVSFGSYASEADADKVIGALRGAGLTAYREATTVAGKPAQRVRIGPFVDRAQAESARLSAVALNPKVDAKVLALDAGTQAPAAVSTPLPAPVAVSPAKPVALPPPPKPAPQPAKPEVAKVDAAKADATKAEAAKLAPVATAPVAAPKPAAAAPAAGTGFAVQVGAFADAAAATSLRDKLRAAGFNAFTDSVQTEGGKRTRVRVGPAMTRAEADALKAQVKAKAGIDGIVRPHP